jgi:hypothetical protein
MEFFCIAAMRGITGGMTSGVTYLETVVGSSVPPGIAAKARRMGLNLVDRNIPVPTVPSCRNCRLLIIACLLFTHLAMLSMALCRKDNGRQQRYFYRLAERRKTLPDRPAPRQPPTARTVFQLMHNMAMITLGWAGRGPRQVTALGPRQLYVIGLLDDEFSIYRFPHRTSGDAEGTRECRVVIQHVKRVAVEACESCQLDLGQPARPR